MRKFISILLFSAGFLLPFGNSQIEFQFSSSTTSPGGTVDVDVTVNNFSEIVIMQFSVNWDPDVFSYQSIVNVTNVLPQFSVQDNFGTPPVSQAVDDGELTVSWNLASTEPVSIPDGTRLFSIRLNVVGGPCDESIFNLSDTPRAIEVIDEDFDEVQVITTSGIVDIEGTNCEGGGGDCTGSSDVVLLAPDIDGEPGENVCLSVTTRNFSNIASLQTGIAWNPAVLSYTGVFEGALTGISLNDADAGSGELRFLYLIQLGEDPVTHPDGTELFQICFDLIGSDGQTSEVSFVNLPNFEVEVADGDGVALPACIEDGRITVGDGGMSGGDCDGTQDVALIASVESSLPGTNICVEVTTKNFSDIASVQSGIQWNSSVLSYTGLTERTLTNVSLNELNAPQGELRILWIIGLMDDPVTVADDTPLFDICFDVVGSNGQMSDVSFVGLPNFNVEIANSDGEAEPTCLQSGTVTAGEGGGGDGFVIRAGQVTADQGENICVDIQVEDFMDIQSGQFNLQWDQSVLSFDRVDNINLPDFGASNANFISPNKLRVSWNPISPVSVADNTSIFQVCFNAIGDCNTQPSSPLDFIGDGNIQIEFTDSENNIIDVQTISGSVGIEPCEGDLNIISVTQPLCNGQAGGSIIASVAGAPTPVTCVWKDSEGNTISTSTTDCNLVGVVAGTYTVEVTDGANNMFSQSVTIDEPDALALNASITDSGCGDAGSIDLNVSGGTTPYSYSWDSGLGNVEDPQNLGPGAYAVTVTDANNCIRNGSFVIDNLQNNLVLSSFSIQNRTCANPGAIDISVDGGCTPYTFAWTGPNGEMLNTEDVGGIGAGSWTIVISDSSDPAQTVSNSFTIQDQIAELSLNVDGITDVSCAGAGDGAINITTTGGCTPYSYSWTGPDGFSSTSADISGLEAGDYDLTIMDNGNPASMLQATLSVTSSGAVAVNGSISNVTNITGDNGAIDLMVSGGSGSGTYTYQWDDGLTTEDRMGLVPGDYSVVVMDGNSCTVSADFSIEWNAIFADSINATIPQVDCVGDNNGEIGGFPIGGCGGTEIRLNGILVELPVSNLEPGTYNLTLRDSCGNEVIKMITIDVPNPIIITIRDIDCADTDANNGGAEIEVEGGTGDYVITWSRGDVDPSGLRSQNLSAGPVSVVVEDDNGCQAAQQDIIIDDCGGPVGIDCDERSIISPNNDGVNDTFVFDCIGGGANQPNRLSIYDRWGRLVFSQDNYDNNWMGTDDRGNPLEEGGYMWVLIINNSTSGVPRIERGTLTILRSTF